MLDFKAKIYIKFINKEKQIRLKVLIDFAKGGEFVWFIKNTFAFFIGQLIKK